MHVAALIFNTCTRTKCRFPEAQSPFTHVAPPCGFEASAHSCSQLLWVLPQPLKGSTPFFLWALALQFSCFPALFVCSETTRFPPINPPLSIASDQLSLPSPNKAVAFHRNNKDIFAPLQFIRTFASHSSVSPKMSSVMTCTPLACMTANTKLKLSTMDQPTQSPVYELDIDVGPDVWSYTLEDFSWYRPGGYHPILLGDSLGPTGNKDRFKVVHKLGHGGFSTVWLCRDNDSGKWRAVKVLAAAVSNADCPDLKSIDRFKGIEPKVLEENHITLPLESFWMYGPNGRHLCLVLPFLGAPLDNLYHNYGHCPELIKDVSFQLTKSVEFLHSHGICHGDFRPANVLFRISDVVNDWTEEKLLEVMDPPSIVPILQTNPEYKGVQHIPGVPKYVVQKAHIDYNTGVSSTNITVSDFGLSYSSSEPHDGEEGTGIPAPYGAPECLFHQQQLLGPAADVWSLACTIMMIRVGQCPFGVDASLTDLVESMETIMGPLPEPYRGKWHEWKGGSLDTSIPASFDQEEEEELADQRFDSYGTRDFLHQKLLRPPLMTINKEQAKQIAEQDYHKNGGMLPNFVYKANYKDPSSLNEYRLPSEEVGQLLDLLRSVLHWDPKARATAATLLDHPWFGGRNRAAPSEMGTLDSTTGPEGSATTVRDASDIVQEIQASPDKVASVAAPSTPKKTPADNKTISPSASPNKRKSPGGEEPQDALDERPRKRTTTPENSPRRSPRVKKSPRKSYRSGRSRDAGSRRSKSPVPSGRDDDDSNITTTNNNNTTNNNHNTNSTSNSIQDNHAPQYAHDPKVTNVSVEPLEWYKPGGLHPVEIGEILNGRYRVAHKLGHGGFATIWLCEDLEGKKAKWKAIKILAATESTEDSPEVRSLHTLGHIEEEDLLKNHIIVPSDFFWIRDGPNGDHLCLAYPFLGSQTNWLAGYYGHCSELFKDIGFQMVRALAFLHSQNLCHGDFRPDNILLCLKDGVDQWPEEKLFEVLGQPERVPVEQTNPHYTGPTHIKNVPKYLVRRTFVGYDTGLCSTKIMVCDFGVAYPSTQPPTDLYGTGIPEVYAAPESLFGLQHMLGPGTDVWALAISIIKMHLGFFHFGERGGTPEEFIKTMEEAMGPLPEPYRAEWFKRCPRDESQPDDPSKPVAGYHDPAQKQRRAEQTFEETGQVELPWLRDRLLLERRLRITSEQARDVSEQEDPFSSGVLPAHGKPVSSFDKTVEPHKCTLTLDEANDLYDLLMRVFRWDPKDRASAEEVLDHPWFGARNKSRETLSSPPRTPTRKTDTVTPTTPSSSARKRKSLDVVDPEEDGVDQSPPKKSKPSPTTGKCTPIRRTPVSREKGRNPRSNRGSVSPRARASMTNNNNNSGVQGRNPVPEVCSSSEVVDTGSNSKPGTPQLEKRRKSMDDMDNLEEEFEPVGGSPPKKTKTPEGHPSDRLDGFDAEDRISPLSSRVSSPSPRRLSQRRQSAFTSPLSSPSLIATPSQPILPSPPSTPVPNSGASDKVEVHASRTGNSPQAGKDDMEYTTPRSPEPVVEDPLTTDATISPTSPKAEPPGNYEASPSSPKACFRVGGVVDIGSSEETRQLEKEETTAEAGARTALETASRLPALRATRRG